MTIYVRILGRVEPTNLTPSDVYSVHEARDLLHLQPEGIRDLVHREIITEAYIENDAENMVLCVLRSDVEAIQAMRNVKIPIQPILDQRGNELPRDLVLIAKMSLLRACYEGEELQDVIDEIDNLDWYTDGRGNILIQANLLSEPRHMEKCLFPGFILPRRLHHIPAADHRYSIAGEWSFKDLSFGEVPA